MESKSNSDRSKTLSIEEYLISVLKRHLKKSDTWVID